MPLMAYSQSSASDNLEQAALPAIQKEDPPKVAHEAAKDSKIAEEGKAIATPSDKADPLLDLPPLPDGKVTLLGGTVETLDRVRDRLVLQPFGGGKRVQISLDPRTQLLRGEKEADLHDLHQGEAVHVETMLNGTAIFAKKIHLATGPGAGEVRGQVVAYNSRSGELSINDELSAHPVSFRVTGSTAVEGKQLWPGTLVQVSFLPGADQPEARQVRVLATPGSVFTFAGRIAFLDLSTHDLVVANESDDRKYELKFDPSQVSSLRQLHEGSRVAIRAQFDGRRYSAQTVTVLSPPAP